MRVSSQRGQKKLRESVEGQGFVCCYLITRCVLTPAGPWGNRRRLLLELPLLATHRAHVVGLLRVQPLHDAVYVETMRALPPHWNEKRRSWSN